MSDKSRLTFEEACSELGISEAELEQLVADGQIASVKDGDSLFFKREVVENYRSSRSDEPSILLSDDEINLLDDEEIDFGIDLEEPAASAEEETAEVSAAPVGSDSEETVLNLDGVLDDDAEATTPIATDSGGLLDDGGIGEDTLLDTDILDLGEEDTDTFDLDTAEETILDPAEEGAFLRGGGARVMQMKRRKSHAAWTAILAVSALILLLPLSVLLSTAFVEAYPSELQGASAKVESFQWIQVYGGDIFSKNIVEPIAALFH